MSQKNNNNNSVVYVQKNLHTPTERIGNSWGRRTGLQDPEKFKKYMKLYWNFLKGRGSQKHTFSWGGGGRGGMDVFWNYTLHIFKGK